MTATDSTDRAALSTPDDAAEDDPVDRFWARVPKPPGPFHRDFWKSAARSRRVTAALGLILLPMLTFVIVTGFLSYAAYEPRLRDNDNIPGGGGMAALLPLRVAHLAELALPAQPGCARRHRRRPHPDCAHQALVGATEAVRLAAGPLGGPAAGADLAHRAGRWHPLRARHRPAEHQLRLRLRLQLLHRAHLRCDRLRRRLRRTRGLEAPARLAVGAPAHHHLRRSRRTRGRPPLAAHHLAPRNHRACRRVVAGRHHPVRGSDHRRFPPAARPALPPWRTREPELPHQPHRRHRNGQAC